MKPKSAKIAAGAALALQTAAIVITIIIFAGQQTVKTFYSMSGINTVHSIPVVSFLINSIPAVIYLVFFIIIMKASERTATAVPIVMLVLCFLKVVLPFLSNWESIFIAVRGTEELASLSVLNQVISQSTGFLATIAFALFCFSAGVCYGVDKREDNL